MGVGVTGILPLQDGVTGVSLVVESIDCLCPFLCFARSDLGPCLIGDAKCYLKLNLEFSGGHHQENA